MIIIIIIITITSCGWRVAVLPSSLRRCRLYSLSWFPTLFGTAHVPLSMRVWYNFFEQGCVFAQDQEQAAAEEEKAAVVEEEEEEEEDGEV